MLQGNDAISCGNSEKQAVKIESKIVIVFSVHNVYLVLKKNDIYTRKSIQKREYSYKGCH